MKFFAKVRKIGAIGNFYNYVFEFENIDEAWKEIGKIYEINLLTPLNNEKEKNHETF